MCVREYRLIYDNYVGQVFILVSVFIYVIFLKIFSAIESNFVWFKRNFAWIKRNLAVDTSVQIYMQ